MGQGRSGFALLVALAAALSAFFTVGLAMHAQQASPPHKRPPKSTPPAAPAPAAEAAMPFRVGEKLEYRIVWSAFPNAATLETLVPEKRDLFGWHTWHFRAAFHTAGSVRKLFTIDDEFDSYTDTATLESRQFESYLNELGKTENSVMHLVVSGQPPRASGGEVIVAPGTRDPIGVLFTLRGVDWQRTPELRAPVYDGHDIYDMRAKLESASETVSVDAGSFRASRVGIQVFQYGKEVTEIRFAVWIANDAARTPVLAVATMPFGDLRVELATQATGAGSGSIGR
jgi:hypothetical protein